LVVLRILPFHCRSCLLSVIWFIVFKELFTLLSYKTH